MNKVTLDTFYDVLVKGLEGRHYFFQVVGHLYKNSETTTTGFKVGWGSVRCGFVEWKMKKKGLFVFACCGLVCGVVACQCSLLKVAQPQRTITHGQMRPLASAR